MGEVQGYGGITGFLGDSLRSIGSTRVCRLRRVHQLIDSQSNSWDETAVRRFFYPYDFAENLKIKLHGEKDDRTALCGLMIKKCTVYNQPIRSAYRIVMCFTSCTMVWVKLVETQHLRKGDGFGMRY
jgi:hypothetical protein